MDKHKLEQSNPDTSSIINFEHGSYNL